MFRLRLCFVEGGQKPKLNDSSVHSSLLDFIGLWRKHEMGQQSCGSPGPISVSFWL